VQVRVGLGAEDQLDRTSAQLALATDKSTARVEDEHLLGLVVRHVEGASAIHRHRMNASERARTVVEGTAYSQVIDKTQAAVLVVQAPVWIRNHAAAACKRVRPKSSKRLRVGHAAGGNNRRGRGSSKWPHPVCPPALLS